MFLEVIRTQTSDRTWWAQVDHLAKKGHEPWFNGLDAGWAEATACSRCGHARMEYRAFTIPGVVNRSFALCDMCEHWLEF